MGSGAPVDPVLGKCRSCGRPVRWVTTAHGRPQPLDPDPNPLGNIVLDTAGVAHQVRPGQALLGAPTRCMPHAATCGGRGLTEAEAQRALRRTRAHVQRELESIDAAPEAVRSEVERFIKAAARRYAGARW